MDQKINQHLSKLKDGQDRIMLKDLMDRLLKKMEEESKIMYKNLEQRVYNEIDYQQKDYEIYTNMINKNDYDIINSFMQPMISTDINDCDYNIEKILKSIFENQEEPIFSVFLEMDYIKIEELIQKNITFIGHIKTEQNDYKAHFKLKKNKSYYKKLEELYQVFVDNDIEWKTINSTYISKILDVIILDCEDIISKEESIISLSVDFEDYQRYIKYNMIPVWNIEEKLISSTGFPIPCEDLLNHEHIIMLKEEGMQHGYLIKGHNENINHITRTKDSLIITSNIKDANEWNIIKIISPNGSDLKNYAYETVSNYQAVSFTQKLASRKRTLKTMAELKRIINSFELSKYLLFKEIKIEKTDNQKEETYSMNFFIIDEIRDTDYQKKLILYFTPQQIDCFITRDLLSFIVSQIQFYYPEYKCEGRLI